MSSDNTNLGDRMKGYEREVNIIQWDGSRPIVIRLDGRAFHSATKYIKEPFNDKLIEIMDETAYNLAEEFNPLLTYVQSDEISMVFYAPKKARFEFSMGL